MTKLTLCQLMVSFFPRFQVMYSPRLTGARGLSHGHIFTREGWLVRPGVSGWGGPQVPQGVLKEYKYRVYRC